MVLGLDKGGEGFKNSRFDCRHLSLKKAGGPGWNADLSLSDQLTGLKLCEKAVGRGERAVVIDNNSRETGDAAFQIFERALVAGGELLRRNVVTTCRHPGADSIARQVAAFEADVDQGHIEAYFRGSCQDRDLFSDGIRKNRFSDEAILSFDQLIAYSSDRFRSLVGCLLYTSDAADE